MTEEEKTALEKEAAEKAAAEAALANKSKSNDDEDDDEGDNKSYVKIREEKAQKKLLKQLGVNSLEEAMIKMNQGNEALTEVNKLKAEIENNKLAQLVENKKRAIISLLDSQKVFDSDALLNYVDISKVNLKNDGSIENADVLVNQLKELKPNYFGVSGVGSDSFIKGTNTPPSNDYTEDYKKGDYKKVVANYIKNLK